MRYGGSALCVLLAMSLTTLTGCGRTDGGVRVEGPAPTAIRWVGPVYMNDARSISRQRPDMVDLTENTTLERLTWRGWGSARAEADGFVIDFACVSGCPGGDPPSFPAHLVLEGLVRRQYAAYYGHAVLTPDRSPAPSWALDVGKTRLPVPKA
ncbi:hypothetical protein PV379_28120 [Streptomyces caniscabiei]|uniref:hypothetical protein n=1 Tax=Streptomyces caniscabiei TaxID=2746961 RepID=UPI0029BACACB|nr:hypothetical protein [Streptomyces caniscabiei]MDX2604441.1 hypothetical protein [Streptomyces caniscabiei]MDX2735783.1 hypothetical protein [Streptomyces caniscabiei]MDX2781135.1 hypothetical protein [Streptomyces caniscabiei]